MSTWHVMQKRETGTAVTGALSYSPLIPTIPVDDTPRIVSLTLDKAVIMPNIPGELIFGESPRVITIDLFDPAKRLRSLQLWDRVNSSYITVLTAGSGAYQIQVDALQLDAVAVKGVVGSKTVRVGYKLQPVIQYKDFSSEYAPGDFFINYNVVDMVERSRYSPDANHRQRLPIEALRVFTTPEYPNIEMISAYIRDQLGAPGWEWDAIEIYDNPELTGIPFVFNARHYDDGGMWVNFYEANRPTSPYGERFVFGVLQVPGVSGNSLELPAYRENEDIQFFMRIRCKFPDGEIAYTKARPFWHFNIPSTIVEAGVEAEMESKTKMGGVYSELNVYEFMAQKLVNAAGYGDETLIFNDTSTWDAPQYELPSAGFNLMLVPTTGRPGEYLPGGWTMPIFDQHGITFRERVNVWKGSTRAFSEPTYPPHRFELPGPNPDIPTVEQWLSVFMDRESRQYLNKSWVWTRFNPQMIDPAFPGDYAFWQYPGGNANKWLMPIRRAFFARYDTKIVIFATPPTGTIPVEDMPPTIEIHRYRAEMPFYQDDGNGGWELVGEFPAIRTEGYGDNHFDLIFDDQPSNPEEPLFTPMVSKMLGGTYVNGISKPIGVERYMWLVNWEQNPVVSAHLGDAVWQNTEPPGSGGLPSAAWAVPRVRLTSAKIYKRDTGLWTTLPSGTWRDMTGAYTPQP